MPTDTTAVPPLGPSIENVRPTHLTTALTALFILTACADPPGLKKPLPIDYAEQMRAEAIYRRIGPEAAKIDGVIGSYLTTTNNPREIVIVMRDEDVEEGVYKQFGSRAEGIKIRYEVAEPGFEVDGGKIKAVETEALPKTWWDKIVYYFKHFALRVMPGGAPSTAPAQPVPSVDQKDLKPV